MTVSTLDTHAEERDRLLEIMLDSTAGALRMLTIYIGDQLGYYPALAKHGPLTSVQLADLTGTHARYAREWLEHQTVSGVLTVVEDSTDPRLRRFALPSGHQEVLAEPESLNYLAPLAQVLVGLAHPIRKLVDCFRSGEGITFGEYGMDMRDGQGRMNRAMFLYQLGQEYLASIPDLHARLADNPTARIADIGCGVGWSSIGVASAYPLAQVDGYDMDEASIAEARRHAEAEGVADRVRFHCKDAGAPDIHGDYDLVLALECVHDMSNPVEALATMRRLAGQDGTVIVMDERVNDSFSAREDTLESFLYGCSVLHCLPAGLAEHPSAGTGTVMRTDTLRGYAQQAGFVEVEVLPIDNFFFRFYRLRG